MFADPLIHTAYIINSKNTFNSPKGDGKLTCPYLRSNLLRNMNYRNGAKLCMACVTYASFYLIKIPAKMCCLEHIWSYYKLFQIILQYPLIFHFLHYLRRRHFIEVCLLLYVACLQNRLQLQLTKWNAHLLYVSPYLVRKGPSNYHRYYFSKMLEWGGHIILYYQPGTRFDKISWNFQRMLPTTPSPISLNTVLF